MTISSRVAAALGASLLLFATPVFAQTSAAPAAAKSDAAAPAPAAKTAKPRSAESLECSRQADEKGLKGKERRKFRSECKKAAMGKKQ